MYQNHPVEMTALCASSSAIVVIYLSRENSSSSAFKSSFRESNCRRNVHSGILRRIKLAEMMPALNAEGVHPLAGYLP